MTRASPWSGTISPRFSATDDRRGDSFWKGSARIKHSEFGITSHAPAIRDDATLTIETEFKAIPAA
jgi:hypothetical protein